MQKSCFASSIHAPPLAGRREPRTTKRATCSARISRTCDRPSRPRPVAPTPETRLPRALQDRAGRRRNARHASEAGLANAAGRGPYCSHGKGRSSESAGARPWRALGHGRRRLSLAHEQQATGPFLWRIARDQLRRAGARHTTRGSRCPNRLVCGDVGVVAAYRAAVPIGGDRAGVHVVALWVRVC